ncbi:hypothetical protein [Seonamhaeicola marinus]|uniref:Uncharacterized protein n=1 Tax=Seonamhaeicola marinus TaxID=1912246 RepID=A0A5D0IML2_9FLAO|nr:hypothetical protein [Seonamhaeicola marinus]TYA84428.1 hypothetical protein FUA24_07225 [Seonamhaeicola marinus]
MEFNTENSLKKVERNKYIAIAVLVFGLFKIFTFNWPYQFTTSSYFGLVQVILLPIIGTVLLVNSLKKIKLISGDFIKFKNNTFHIKSRGLEKEICDLNEVDSININLDNIVINCSNNSCIKIYLEDYNEIKVRKEIKKNFEILKTEMTN